MKQITTTLFLALFSLSMGQVGISKSNDFRPNTNVEGDIVNSDSSPVMLDVDGQTRVRTMPVAEPNTYSPVVRNNKTGVLEILTELTNSNKPFNVTTYSIEKVDQDWLEDFDTKIPADKWTVAVTGFRFKNARSGNAFVITNRNSVKSNLRQYYPDGENSPFSSTDDEYLDHWEDFDYKYDVFAAPSIYAYRRGGTWRLYADFPGAGTDGKYQDSNGQTYDRRLFEDGDWKIDVLIIDNSYVGILGSTDNPTVNLGGSSSGSAPSNPMN